VVLGQPQRLRQREREDALQARPHRAVDQRPDADGLGGQAHRRRSRPGEQLGGVRVECVELDDRERRVEVRGGGVERAEIHGRTVLRFRRAGPLECRAARRT
jgi:hypothetical protein